MKTDEKNNICPLCRLENGEHKAHCLMPLVDKEAKPKSLIDDYARVQQILYGQITELQSDNAAKQKRIRELEINFTEAVANIQNLNQCLDKAWNDRSTDKMSENHIYNITQAQMLSRTSVTKWESDAALTQ